MADHGVAVLECLSFCGYVILFRTVFVRGGTRIGWRASYEITMAGVAATRLFAAAGAGGIALTAWALRRSGMEARVVACRMVAFLALLYAVYMGSIVVFGLGLYFGLFNGPAPFAITVVPAIFALLLIGIFLAMSLLPGDAERRITRWSGGSGRGARIMAKVVTIPASAATGVRTAIDLVRNREWGVLGAVAWWGFDIATLWACFHAYGPDPPPFAVIVLAYFVGMLGNALPLPGGIGGVDGGMIGAFAALGVSSDYAISAVLTYRAFAFWLPTLPGAIAYFQLRRRVAAWREEHQAAKARGGGAGVTDGRRRATIQSKVSTESERDPVADIENVIIVGSGPAGYTAALYTARANLRPLVIEGFLWGGLLQQTTEVENYPGFPAGGIQGPELMQKMRDQAEDFGTRFITDQATKVELSNEPGGIHKVWVGDDEYQARTVVLAMGAEHKKLGVPGEEELGGAGVSYCATCDAAFFKEHDTIIVGGGDSAMEEAIFLAKFASKVHIVHRRDEFRASKIMLERARAIENIEFLTPYVVEEFHEGDGPVRARRAAAQRRDRRGARAALRRRLHRHRPRAAVGASSRARCRPTTRTTSSPRASRRAPACRACSPRATSSTTPTARP